MSARGTYVPPIDYVTAYMRLNEKELAFSYLATAVGERNRLAFEAKINPTFDPLRKDPRFNSLFETVFNPR